MYPLFRAFLEFCLSLEALFPRLIRRSTTAPLGSDVAVFETGKFSIFVEKPCFNADFAVFETCNFSIFMHFR